MFIPIHGQQELHEIFAGTATAGGWGTLDDFADALIHLANRSYPSLEPKLRMELARDRFVAGVRSEHVQEALLKSPPDTLDDARGTARRMEAAQAARKLMRSKRSDVLAVTTDARQGGGEPESTECVAALTTHRRDDGLVEAVRRNTAMLERLLAQMTSSGNQEGASGPTTNPPRRRPLTCWQCGQRGHIRRNCPSGNEQRLAPRVNRQSRTQ